MSVCVESVWKSVECGESVCVCGVCVERVCLCVERVCGESRDKPVVFS